MPKLRSIVRWFCWACAGALTMAAALWFADGRAPRAEPLQEHPFVLATSEDKPLGITAAVPLILPYDFGDCDVLANVEVPADGELDVVFRRVEPAGAHGRFGVLRLSSSVEGPPFLTERPPCSKTPARGACG